MAEVSHRELRSGSRELLSRVEAGEDVTITVDGRRVAVLTAVADRPRWICGARLARLLATSAADAGLTADLADLAPGSTDEAPPLSRPPSR